MKPCILLPRAEADLFDASIWYENEREGLGLAFEEDFDNLVVRIRQAPKQFPKLEPQVRRALFRRFPYAVFFVEENDEPRSSGDPSPTSSSRDLAKPA